VFTTTESASVTTADRAVALWALAKASELARLDLYVEYARLSAQEGELEVARDVALETVGHVSLEDPRPHLLLGQIAVALGDGRLLGEARAFLRYFEHEPWERRLDQAVRSGGSDFEGPE
jgi:hypothetical protein